MESRLSRSKENNSYDISVPEIESAIKALRGIACHFNSIMHMEFLTLLLWSVRCNMIDWREVVFWRRYDDLFWPEFSEDWG